MERLIDFDQALAQAINTLAGGFWLLDEIVKGVANDYFLVVSASLGLLLLWFGTKDQIRREANQKSVLQAMASLGLGTWVVAIFNSVMFRARPFDEIPVTVLLYQPTDSSFPANSATILFAIAAAIWLSNRKAGKLFFAIALTHSLARIYAGMYYPLDIIGGAVIGIVSALFVLELFQVINPIINWLLGQARKVFLA